METLNQVKAKKPTAATSEIVRGAVAVAPAPAETKEAEAVNDCQHEWQYGGGWKRCAKCGFQPELARRATVSFVVAGRGVDGRRVLREIFTDGSHMEANPTRKLV
jgi:hypothetical protein